jgi:Tol biopolymer transport system component
METRHEKIRAQLERLVVSAEFARADKMVRFLRFVVEQSLAENVEALKERQIGIEVFDRPKDWDPKLDNVVRSEARRLRGKLEAYASSSNPDETVRITIPKGGYQAEFTQLPGKSQPSDPSGDPPLGFFSGDQTKTQPGWWAAAASASFIGVLAIVAGVFLAWRQHSVHASVDSFEIVPFSDEIGEQFSPSIAPDGTRIAYVWDGNGSNYDIYIKDLKSGAVKRLTEDNAPDIHPSWSPDAKKIAFLRQFETNTAVFIEDVSHNTEHEIGHIQNAVGLWSSDNPLAGCQSPTWSPDGRQLLLTDVAGSSGIGLVLMSVTSGLEKSVTTPPAQDEDCYPRFSPDGSRIAFVRYISHGVGELFTMATDGSDLHQLTAAQVGIRGLDWTRDGRQLVFALNRGGAYELRKISREGGNSMPLPSDTASASDPAISPKGDWMAFVESNENWNIWRVPLQGSHLGHPERFLASLGHNHSPSYSPDGSLIGFVSDRSGNPEIWLSNSDGKNLRQLTHFGGPWLGTIRWSPDGQWIVFDARPNGHSEIFTMSISSGKPKLFEQENFEDRRPSWSRDGKSIYFDTTRSGKPQIWKRSLETGISKPIAPENSLVPTESLDGKALFFTSNSGQHDLWSSRVDGSNLVRVENVHPDPDLDWCLGKDAIYFAVGGQSSAKFYRYAFGNRQVTKIGELPQSLSLGTPSLVTSPDGKWLLYATVDHLSSNIKIRRESSNGGTSRH